MSQPTPTPLSNPNLKVVRATSSAFEAEDCNDGNFFITGKLQSGILTFTVQAVNGQGHRGPSNFTGTDFFEAMWTHFAPNVFQIEADWSVGSGLTTNIDELNQLTSPTGGGLRVIDAATLVWTGRRAVSKGLTKATVKRALPSNAQGKYQEVIVLFSIP